MGEKKEEQRVAMNERKLKDHRSMVFKRNGDPTFLSLNPSGQREGSFSSTAQKTAEWISNIFPVNYL